MENLAITQSTAPASVLADRWANVFHLSCKVSIDIPVSRFTVAQFLNLEVNSVIDTGQEASSNLTVIVNGHLIGWGEFELIGERLGVHVVELV